MSLTIHPRLIKTELRRNIGTETLEAIQAMKDRGSFGYKTAGAGAGAATGLVNLLHWTRSWESVGFEIARRTMRRSSWNISLVVQRILGQCQVRR